MDLGHRFSKQSIIWKILLSNILSLVEDQREVESRFMGVGFVDIVFVELCYFVGEGYHSGGRRK